MIRAGLVLFLFLLAACTTGTDGTPTGPTNVPSGPSSSPFEKRVFDARKVEEGVQKILKDRYMEDVQTVTCPEDQEVKKGRKFDCAVTVGGAARKVTITVVSEEDGSYEVSASK